jgi:hypothetical protein
VDDLVQFLRNRLNDDVSFMHAAIRLRESGAVTASPAATEGAFALMDVVMSDPDTVDALTLFTRTGTRAPGEAERVLEEVEAKRELLRQYEHLKYDVMPDDMTGVWALETILRAFALPYSGHPDYNEAWRP